MNPFVTVATYACLLLRNTAQGPLGDLSVQRSQIATLPHLHFDKAEWTGLKHSVITDVEHLSRSGRRRCAAKKGYHCLMAFLKKDTSHLHAEEHDLHKALKASYLTPGIWSDLRNKENEAVQTVSAALERRRMAPHTTGHSAKLSASTKAREAITPNVPGLWSCWVGGCSRPGAEECRPVSTLS